MKEITGDIFSFIGKVDIICITTNGDFNKHGMAIMGAGVARGARERFPVIAATLGRALKSVGNIPHLLTVEAGTQVWSFPTKQRWRDKSDLALIEKSALILASRLESRGHRLEVLLPRPGCQNGGLSWDQVRPVIEPILGNLVTIISKE